MSRYQVDKVLRQVSRDISSRETYQADPISFLTGWDLTDQERDALIKFDYPTLYRLGAHPFLLLQFVRMARRGDPRTLEAEWDKNIGPLGRPDFST